MLNLQKLKKIVDRSQMEKFGFWVLWKSLNDSTYHNYVSVALEHQH